MAYSMANVHFKDELTRFMTWNYEHIGKIDDVYSDEVKKINDAVLVFVATLDNSDFELKMIDVRLRKHPRHEQMFRFSVCDPYMVVIDCAPYSKCYAGELEYWLPERSFLTDPLFYANAIMKQVDLCG